MSPHCFLGLIPPTAGQSLSFTRLRFTSKNVRGLAGCDAIANLVPRSGLDTGGVADRHRSWRNFPRESFGCGNEHEVADAPQRIRVHEPPRREKWGRKLRLTQARHARQKRFVSLSVWASCRRVECRRPGIPRIRRRRVDSARRRRAARHPPPKVCSRATTAR